MPVTIVSDRDSIFLNQFWMTFSLTKEQTFTTLQLIILNLMIKQRWIINA